MKAKLGLAFRGAEETGLILDSDVQFAVKNSDMIIAQADGGSSIDLGVWFGDKRKLLIRFVNLDGTEVLSPRLEFFKNGALRMFCIAVDLKVEMSNGLVYHYEVRYFFDNDCSFVKRKVKYMSREHGKSSGGSSFSPDDISSCFDVLL